jgi:dGTP triphosphohydrolase
MPISSEFWIYWEKKNLAPYAVHSDHPWYTRRHPDEDPDRPLDYFGSRSRYRTPFEIDKDRITNSQAFRRLEYKTQVFVTHEGDNYRTRLTHSLEVAELARHIARALRLNEHLVEAIALGHDLGHAPYGHIAEQAINDWITDLNPKLPHPYYFCHNRHSVENVDHLEPGYDWDNRPMDRGFARGMNLTQAVREGLLVHTGIGYRGMIHRDVAFDLRHDQAIEALAVRNKREGLFFPGSLEAQVVRVADDIAQRIHDLEDGLRSRMLCKDDIREVLRVFFDDLKERFFPGGIVAQIRDRHLTHPVYKTKVSLAFLAHVLSVTEDEHAPGLIAEIGRELDRGPVRMKYADMEERFIVLLGVALHDNADFQEEFSLVALVAFMLHMWRDEAYLDQLEPDTLRLSKARILKYFSLLRGILRGEDHRAKEPPAYHYIAFLRGLFLANVIEHSFRYIHGLLDSEFRMREAISDRTIENATEQAPAAGVHEAEQPAGDDDPEDAHFYDVFVVVDGFTNNAGGGVHLRKTEREDRFYAIWSTNGAERRQFIRDHFEEILHTNGLHLESLEKGGRVLRPKGISWLSRPRDVGSSETVGLIFRGPTGQQIKWIPIERVQIHFTGYRDLCPGGTNRACGNSPTNVCLGQDHCDFWDSHSRYPDITRLIDFQQYAFELDQALKRLIRGRIHHGSRLQRMNAMGEMVIKELLTNYLKRPRLMHDRVWSRLRIYSGTDNPNPVPRDAPDPVKQWIGKPITEKDKEVIPESVLEKMRDQSDGNYAKRNYYSLVRRIVEHVAGMTDRFIANEFSRCKQPGREVEPQDETYFFS